MFPKILKTIAFILIGLSGIILTGLGNSILRQPEGDLWNFIFLSQDTFMRHIPIGILGSIVLFFVIKKSIQMLMAFAIILIIAAAALWYFI